MKQGFKVLKILIPLSIFIVIIATILVSLREPYHSHLVIEAGDTLFSPAYFFTNLCDDAVYVTENDKIDLRHVGENHIKIRLRGLIYNVSLEVVDTVPPQVVPKSEYVCYSGTGIDPIDFIESAKDVTRLKYTFETEPDYYTEGTRPVTIIVTDEGGNSVKVESKHTVYIDEEPPVILGVRDRVVGINSTVVYRDSVYVSDNRDGAYFEVDSSAVDITKEGVYPVIYKAYDASGNESSVTCNLTVTGVTIDYVSEEEINRVFRDIYNEIITDDMTKVQKARAIFDYTMNNIAFVGDSDKTDWKQNAYDGVMQMKGDCYTYYSVSRMLYEMAGIETLCVKRIDDINPSNHYWSMINCGDGWYYCDACPRAYYSDELMFMWTDDEVDAFNEKIRYYITDKSRYPATGN